MKIGLALSSGSLRGLSHIGVLKELEKNKIKINYIAGSSTGALIGALYASGLKAKSLEKIALSINIEKLADFTIPYEGLIKGNKIEDLIRKLTKNKTFSQLKIPLSITATDITSGKELIINKGNISKAVRASISIPLIFQPCKINKRIIVDGGITNPLPVDIVKKMGADFIIAVDTTPSLRNIKNTNLNTILKKKLINDEFKILEKNQKDYTKLILNSTKKILANRIGKLKLPYPLTLTLDSIAIMEKQLAKDNARYADIVIKPDLSRSDLLSYDPYYYIKQGEKAASRYTESFINLRSFKKSK